MARIAREYEVKLTIRDEFDDEEDTELNEDDILKICTPLLATRGVSLVDSSIELIFQDEDKFEDEDDEVLDEVEEATSSNREDEDSEEDEEKANTSSESGEETPDDILDQAERVIENPSKE